MQNTSRIFKANVLVIFMAGIFFSCHKPNEVAQLINEETLPFQTTYNGEYTFTEDAKIRNIIKAGKLEHYTTDSSFIQISEGLHLEIYNRSQHKEGILTAKKGTYFEKSKFMWAEDSVQFKNLEGEVLHTEKLIWNEKAEKIYTEEPVMIIRQLDTIWGDGMTSNESFSNYSIKNPRGSIFVEEPAQDEP